jgi:hypothetical protein
MSFAALPTALYACISQFFIYEPSANPTRSKQATNGRVLVMLNRETRAMRKQIVRPMKRVTVDRGYRMIERDGTDMVTDLRVNMIYGVNMMEKTSPRITYDERLAVFITRHTVQRWNEELEQWVEKPHPVLFTTVDADFQLFPTHPEVGIAQWVKEQSGKMTREIILYVLSLDTINGSTPLSGN